IYMKANSNTEPLIEIWSKGYNGQAKKLTHKEIEANGKYQRVDVLVHNKSLDPIDYIKIKGDGIVTLYFDDISFTEISTKHPYKQEIIQMEPWAAVQQSSGYYKVSWDSTWGNNPLLGVDHGGKRAKWIKTYDESKDAYQFKNFFNPNKVLGLKGGLLDYELQVVDNEFSNLQYWTLKEFSDGYYQIINKEITTLVMDLLNNNVSNGNYIQKHDRRYENDPLISAQKFYFSN
ncbi:RICIN domain-containing protein, partial [Bacillus cereus]|uniref:RICIN domain-containing protein n=1 Tax=Bacillus cereus TaxID=1396 RepID=UPI000BFAC90B